MIIYHRGDLFESTADALAHGCNIRGRMNAGIAVEFKHRFPEMYQDYFQRCDRDELKLGTGYMYADKRNVINLMTQSEDGTPLFALHDAFEWLAQSYDKLGINSVAIPMIGTGLGKLEQTMLKKIAERYFGNIDLKVEIWDTTE